MVRVRQLVRSAAVSAGLSLVDQTKLVTAASELARNTLIHGGGGRVEVSRCTNGTGDGDRARLHRRGAGHPERGSGLHRRLHQRDGLGLGLSGAKRLVDEFELETVLESGTTVRVTKWKR